MAPKRKTTASTRNAARAEARATRSATLRGQAILNPPVDDPQPRKRRRIEEPVPAPVAPAPAPAPVASSSAAGASPSAARTSPSAARASPSAARASPSAARASPSATRASPSAARASPSATRASPSAARASPSAARASSSAAVRTVIIEHCLQNDLFKRKADQVRKGLEKAVSGVNVVVNPEAPRKGCFEIREEGGDAFVSLLDIHSPFNEVKAVDVKKVVAEIVGKIK